MKKRHAAALALTLAAPATAHDPRPKGTHPHHGQEVRFATFNASLNRATEGQLERDLSTGDNEQARNVAETLQRANPDVVLVNEFDYVPGGKAAAPPPPRSRAASPPAAAGCWTRRQHRRWCCSAPPTR